MTVRIRIAIPLILTALALSACGAPAGGGSSGGNSGGGDSDVTLTIDDLRGIVQEGDGLSTLDFEASEVTATAADDAESMSGYWAQSGGSPDDCYPAFAASYLLDGSESGDSGGDDTMEIAVFTEPGADDYGLVLVNGRIFGSSDDAAAFLDSVSAATEACPDGYTLSDGGDVTYESTGFDLGALAGAPDGVATLTSTEKVSGGNGLRTTYLQRGNAVVAVYAEAYEGGTFVIDDVDAVAGAAAERLAAL